MDRDGHAKSGAWHRPLDVTHDCDHTLRGAATRRTQVDTTVATGFLSAFLFRRHFFAALHLCTFSPEAIRRLNHALAMQALTLAGYSGRFTSTVTQSITHIRKQTSTQKHQPVSILISCYASTGDDFTFSHRRTLEKRHRSNFFFLRLSRTDYLSLPVKSISSQSRLLCEDGEHNVVTTSRHSSN